MLAASFFTLLRFTPETEPETEAPEPVHFTHEQLTLVAHAGGAISGYVYSNSLEAFEESVVHNIQLLEVDFMPTSDGVIVLTHVWQGMPSRIPGAGTHIMSHDEFLSARLFNRYTTMDLSMLIDFLDEHPDVRIVTDTKDGYDNYTALYVIAEQYPAHLHRFIAQAYRFEHVPRLRALGFEDVIVTLYLMPAELRENPAEIQRLALEYEVYAITISEYGILPEFAAELGMEYIRYFAHTVNSYARAEELRQMGFYGIYTNHLVYDADANLVPARAPNPARQAAQLAENLPQLDETQQEILAESLFYQLDTPVYIRHGEPHLVSYAGTTLPYPGFAQGVASPLVRFDTGVLYLPLSNILTESMTYTWNAQDNALTIGTLDIPEGFLLYRNIMYLSQGVIEHLFSYHILLAGDYVLVAPVPAEWSEEDILTLGRIVFDGI